MSTPKTMSPPTPRLTLIVAVTPSLGIGRANTLPWPRIKSEMSYFSRMTKRLPTSHPSISTTNAVIMGRKTWESIPAKFRPLPGRINVVVSRKPAELNLGVSADCEDEAFAVGSLQEALGELERRERGCGRVFVIGGAQVYAEALRGQAAERVLLTRIKRDYECDTFFPVRFGEQGAEGWELQGEEARDEWLGEQNPGGEEWSVEMWTRKGGEVGN